MRSSHPDGEDLRLRPGSPADAQQAGEVCYEAFKAIAERHGFPPDFPSAEVAAGLMREILSRPDIYAVVAESEGQVIGSNFLWETDTVAGVGPITVDTHVQNRSVGRQLMGAVLKRARRKGIRSVRLVQAAYHGRSLSLYSKLGFETREPLAVMQGRPLGTDIAGRVVRTATRADLDAANELCRRVHGHHRAGELQGAVQQGTAAVAEWDGHITGYTTGLGFFGHAVGETTQDVKALIASAPSFSGPGLLVPMRNSELFRWCLEHGLRVVQPMTLMSMGPYEEPRGAYLPSVLY